MESPWNEGYSVQNPKIGDQRNSNYDDSKLVKNGDWRNYSRARTTITLDEILSKILIWGLIDSRIFGGALVMEEFGVA